MNIPAPKTVVLQTEGFRVVWEPGDRNKIGRVFLEVMDTSAMGEKHWHTEHELSVHMVGTGSPGADAFKHDVLRMFDQLGSGLKKAPPIPERTQTLATILEVLAKYIRMEGVTITQGDFPHNNRDNQIGLDIPPGLVGDLDRVYPGIPYPVPLGVKLDKLFKEVSKLLLGDKSPVHGE